MDNRKIFVILLILLLSFCSKKKAQNDYILKECDSEFLLYSDPSTDCYSCIKTALLVLDRYYNKDRQIYVLLKKSSIVDNFISSIESEFKHNRLIFLKKASSLLRVPHPSILFLQNGRIYMYIYIPNDEFLLSKNIQKVITLLNLFYIPTE